LPHNAVVKMRESRLYVSQIDRGKLRRPHGAEEGRLSRLDKNSNVLGVEKPVAEEPSGHRLLAWVIRHLGWPCSRGIYIRVVPYNTFAKICDLVGLQS